MNEPKNSSNQSAILHALADVVPTLRWLETLINCPAVTWNDGQKAAALMDLAKGRAAIVRITGQTLDL